MSKSLLRAYETDASQFKGKVNEVVFPNDIGEVCSLVKELKGVVPRGAGTGFCGGVVPVNSDDVVMDLSKINGIDNLDIGHGTVEVGCGVVLNDLNNFLKKSRLEF